MSVKRWKSHEIYGSKAEWVAASNYDALLACLAEAERLLQEIADRYDCRGDFTEVREFLRLADSAPAVCPHGTKRGYICLTCDEEGKDSASEIPPNSWELPTCKNPRLCKATQACQDEVEGACASTPTTSKDRSDDPDYNCEWYACETPEDCREQKRCLYAAGLEEEAAEKKAYGADK